MAVNVANIFENIIKPGKSYCRICLRTAEETTLVAPRNLRMFTDVLKLNLFDSKQTDTACYICEATASTALRMYQACVNAVSVRNVCNPLKTMRRNHAVPEWLRSAIVTCNANLKEYRQRSTLMQTEVLVVDSAGIEWQPGNSADPISIIAPSIPAQPQYETVILDDDDEAPPPAVKRLVPIEQMLNSTTKDKSIASLLPNQMQIISRNNAEENFILHPLVLGNNGKIVAPSLSSFVKDDLLVFDPDIFQELPVIDCTNNKSEITCVIENPQYPSGNSETDCQKADDAEEILPDENRTKIARLRYYGTDKVDKVLPVPKTYLNQNKLNKKRTSNASDVGEDKVKKKREESQYIVDLNMVNDILSNKSDSDPIAVISNVMSTNDGMGVITEVVSRPAGLQERSSKIDWEDKIPMDVISFVDATDPNERELIVPDPFPVSRQASNGPPAEPPPPAPTKSSNPAPAAQPNNHLVPQPHRQYDSRKLSTVIDLC